MYLRSYKVRKSQKKNLCEHGASSARERMLTRTPTVIVLAGLCCLLWGSAFPCIKIGNGLFGIIGGDIASEVLFAGIRFSLAGVLVLVFVGLSSRRLPTLNKSDVGPALVLSIFQTTLQYALFYPGVSMSQGTTASIVEGAGTFFTVLMAALLFGQERLTRRKVLGCLVGFTGVALISASSSATSASDGSQTIGTLLILASTLAASTSACLIKGFSEKHDPVLLSGWQFLIGGISLSVAGLAAGGQLKPQTAAAAPMLLYLALISALAYSIWSILLKHNEVSRVVIFGFMNPVFGVILSILLLAERPAIAPLQIVVALALVCVGIVIVNRVPHAKS